MKKLTTESFIETAHQIHNYAYNYSTVEYKNMRTKIEITCPIHGIFCQKPKDHIHQKQGCPKCSHNYPYSIADIRQKSKDLFGSKFFIETFESTKKSMDIFCCDHGRFTLKIAEVHFRKNSKGGCPGCCLEQRLENLKPGNISKVEKEWLDNLNVPLWQYKLLINNETFLADGFDPNTNTVYECYGSFWHGNPKIYPPKKINSKVGKTFGYLYDKTLRREEIIKTQYNLITKWI